MTFSNPAQERADRIKARRQAEAAEDTFDTRPPALHLVPPVRCGHRQGGWVCVSADHPDTEGHYFAKEGVAS